MVMKTEGDEKIKNAFWVLQKSREQLGEWVRVCVRVDVCVSVLTSLHWAAAINQIGLNTISLNAVTEQEVVPQAQKMKYFNQKLSLKTSVAYFLAVDKSASSNIKVFKAMAQKLYIIVWLNKYRVESFKLCFF